MPKRSRAPQRQTTTSNTYRFFVEAGVLHAGTVRIDDPDLAHQVGTVLRLRPGERLILLDNSGWQYTVALSAVERGCVAGEVERKELAGGEPRTKVTLYAALMRPERFEWVLQKGTELGVSAFVPLICERSTIGDADALSEHKHERWRRIIREAAEQSRRGKLPRLAPAVMFPAACDQAAKRGAALLLWEGAGVASLRHVLHQGNKDASKEVQGALALPISHSADLPFSVALFSGPEGGFSQHELETATRYGIIPVTLGPRTLRAETAPLAATSAILYEMGDLE
ncbi:MAG TPA: RsmE family RNA methyltransferase [Kouleothrix sp.]|uniref:RsmE family RNA methyltransferase n=1 Tax=Kouleothrix sp. TaxID=2779161 RepID=UPI002CE10F67|nr:RsmE family RNA methyltransferase [Kouleothrix sp.]HRC75338.1 RsmE family RNA methyltransferase [Kouleothrix sp.]